MTICIYSIKFDFPNGYDVVQLFKEMIGFIENEIIRINVDISTDALIIEFLRSLSHQDNDIIDSVIAKHIPNQIDIDDNFEFTYNVDLNGNRILNVGDPMLDSDGANKLYVETSVSRAYDDSKEYIDMTKSNIVEMITATISSLDHEHYGQVDGDVMGTTAIQVVENKTMDATLNHISNITDKEIDNNAQINASKIANGFVSNRDYQNIGGLTDNAQDQFDKHSMNLCVHQNNKLNPHHVTKQQIGLNNVQNIKNNFNATSMPSKLDDVVAGYSVGSRWINQVTLIEYACLDSTEIKAIWKVTTGSDMILKNVGDGHGIWKNNIDSTNMFKSINGSDNVSIESGLTDITIKSKDTYSFVLSVVMIEVLNSVYTDIFIFPWMQSEFGGYKNGKIIFEAIIDPLNALSIRIINISENSVLGEISLIDRSDFYTMYVGNPPKNARLKVQVSNSGIIGANPIIYGLILQYNS
jgi:hypothetical protein